eukprot:610123-Rhodomonas_salina.3
MVFGTVEQGCCISVASLAVARESADPDPNLGYPLFQPPVSKSLNAFQVKVCSLSPPRLTSISESLASLPGTSQRNWSPSPSFSHHSTRSSYCMPPESLSSRYSRLKLLGTRGLGLEGVGTRGYQTATGVGTRRYPQVPRSRCV